MIHKLFVPLILAGAILGCSKKEESPPSPAPKAEMKSSSVDSASSNAQNAIAATTSRATDLANIAANSVTNAVQSAAASKNAVAQKATEVANSSPPTAPAVPASSVVPATSPPSTPTTPANSMASLSTDQVTQGLKEALGQGLQHAVSTLGQPGGFLTNLNVKIPIPEKLQLIEKGLRAINQGQYADQCITTMNQAAEQAVPAAAEVFVNSLKNMSVEDAKGLVSGPPDAATQFFRKATEAELTTKFSPIIQQAMTKSGTTAAYQQLLDKAKGVSPFFSNPNLDLNAYVTGKAMDGLFIMVAEEEKRIRENPVARGTDLLKSVFGSLGK